jgi:hypothetical protein
MTAIKKFMSITSIKPIFINQTIQIKMIPESAERCPSWYLLSNLVYLGI